MRAEQQHTQLRLQLPFIVRLLCFSVIDVLYVSLQYFDTVGWVT